MRAKPYSDIIACRTRLQRLGWRVEEIGGDGGMKVVGVRNSESFACIGGSALVLWNGALECAEKIESGGEGATPVTKTLPA